MAKYKLHSKQYQPIKTILNGSSFNIPQKGIDIIIEFDGENIPANFKELIKENKIKLEKIG